MKKIGIVVALNAESIFLKEQLGTLLEVQTIGTQSVFIYSYENKTIYLINSQVGQINATIATTVLITTFTVEVILNFGAVGGLRDDFGLSDMVCASSVVHYDFDLSRLDNLLPGQYPWFDGVCIPTTKNLVMLAKELSEYTLKEGVIASGDKFIASFQDKSRLIDTFNGDICDMEAAGIACTCTYFSIPFSIIKIISDKADSNSMFDFKLFIQSGIDKYCHLAKKMITAL